MQAWRTHRSVARCVVRGSGGSLPPSPALRLYDVRVCTNRTCKRQGSQQVLKFVQDLQLENIDAQASGCLGICGNGPNVAVVERGAPAGPSSLSEPLVLSHVATPRDAAEALGLACGVGIDEADVAAVQLRLQGNALAVEGDLEGAVCAYSSGLAAHPRHGGHLLMLNRSAAQLQLGRKQEALDDALAALEASPPGFAKAYIRAIDCYYALGRHADAADVYVSAVSANPKLKQQPEFKAARQALDRAGQARVVLA
ncbi:hypothetical protein FOA52_006545 [Chlamydomonas sp. UWO 241]|nr:hypothetical protein FOA52_006545 [Chlamydomonas sp. UWO 241]